MVPVDKREIMRELKRALDNNIDFVLVIEKMCYSNVKKKDESILSSLQQESGNQKSKQDRQQSEWALPQMQQ